MEVEVVETGKDEMEIKVDDVTIAELLRVYLNENVSGVKFAAWRREHPSKPALLRIECSSGSVKKVVGDAIKAIKKDCDDIVSELKN